METAFKKVRLIQWALLLAIPLFAWVAEIGLVVIALSGGISH